MHCQYTVILERNEDGGYTATAPALKGCVTEGATLTEAITNAQEAIACYLESLAKHNEPFPADVKAVYVGTTHASEVFITKMSVEVALPVEIASGHR